MRDINWAAIRAEYEQGLSSLSALERAHCVSRQAIKKRANKEQWVTPPQQVTGTSSIQKVPNRDVNAALRVATAIKYRQSGLTYERIARLCGYSDPSSCRHAIQRELDRVIVQNIEEWRNDHISRLEMLHEKIWPLAVPDEDGKKVSLFAVDRLLAIAEREAKLLGLDAKADDNIGPQIIIEEVPMGYFVGTPT